MKVEAPDRRRYSDASLAPVLLPALLPLAVLARVVLGAQWEVEVQLRWRDHVSGAGAVPSSYRPAKMSPCAFTWAPTTPASS